MDIPTAWLIGPMIVRESSLPPREKAARQDSINFIQSLRAAVQMKNFRLRMPNMVHTRQMEKRSQLPSVRKWDAIGNVIAVDGKRISIFLIYKHKRPKV